MRLIFVDFAVFRHICEILSTRNGLWENIENPHILSFLKGVGLLSIKQDFTLIKQTISTV